MKQLSRNLFIFTAVLVITLALFSTFSSAGQLVHTIISPFGQPVYTMQTAYFSDLSSQATTSSIIGEYEDYQNYPEDTKEPFCKIGGQYKINVYNDPRPGNSPSNVTYNLYYCKTTLDLLKVIKIPSNWQEDNLIVYCNDGANINFPMYNFEYLTTKMNAYKSCIVKNLDIPQYNTIVYGYEVGNRIVDNYPEYFFNNETNTSPVLADLTYTSMGGQSNISVSEYGGRAIVPYQEITQYCLSSSNDINTCITCDPNSYYDSDSGSSCIEKTFYRKLTSSEAIEYIRNHINQYANEVVQVSDTQADCTPSYGDSGNSDESCTPSVLDETIYTFRYSFDHPVTDYVYTDERSNQLYYYKYDTYQKYFILTNFESELNTPITTVFPQTNNIGLSRIALFKKSGNNIFYGYENVALRESSMPPYSDSLKPIYKIIMSSVNGFNANKCSEVLARYNRGLYSIDFNDQVSCQDNVIGIVSDNLNNGDESKAFHLFKNIMTTIK